MSPELKTQPNIATRAFETLKKGVNSNASKVGVIGVAAFGASELAPPILSEANAQVPVAPASEQNPLRSMEMRMCRDVRGVSALYRYSVKKPNSQEKSRVTVITPEATECNEYGVRTISSIKFLTQSNKRKQWKTSQEFLKKPLVTNSSKTLVRKTDLNNLCKPGDKFLRVKQRAEVTYRENQTGQEFKKIRTVPLSAAVKVKC